MPAEGDELAIHASAVAIGGAALLICGRSRAGKSGLAFALMGASTPERPIALLGDDRILLSRRGSAVRARPHPRIAGFIERRGLGLVAVAHVPVAPVAAIADLGDAASTLRLALLQNFPVLSLVSVDAAADRRATVLRWWTGLQGAACAPHLLAKAPGTDQAARKD